MKGDETAQANSEFPSTLAFPPQDIAVRSGRVIESKCWPNLAILIHICIVIMYDGGFGLRWYN